MYRISEAIEAVGNEFLLNLMYCETPIYVTKKGENGWKAVKYKVVAITNDRLLVAPYDMDCEKEMGYGSDNPFIFLCCGYENIADYQAEWFTDEEGAVINASLKNEEENN